MIENILTMIAIYAIPCIFAITMHEAAHGLVAKLCGDNTAYAAGRVTLNPIPHIDLWGTILIPGALLIGTMISGGMGVLFGWAKPVPVNYDYLRHPRRDSIWVALAGPGSNLLQALIWAILIKVALMLPVGEAGLHYLLRLCEAGVGVNLMLMAFNIIPIPPLDGGRVVTSLLPWQLAQKYAQLERYGFLIVLVLLMTGMLNYFLYPFLAFGQAVIQLVL